jgi:two-component system C4-dicarboxylate transport response regulator DctD
MNGGQLLFVDDDLAMREATQQWLMLAGYQVATAVSAENAMAFMAQKQFDVVITDVKLPKHDGVELLDRIIGADPLIPVILVTGHGNVPMAVDAMRRGAFDFLEKPYDPEALIAVVRRAIDKRSLSLELKRLGSPRSGSDGLETRIIGKSPAAIVLRRNVEQLTALDCDVIVIGETGSGKEVVARALHDFGRRARARYVAVNCAAIPADMFESELFGHEPGAFTGAKGLRIGKFEYASGGTLLLDEIESMPMSLQAKVLRTVQERTIERLGSNRQINCDVQIIAATKEDLEAASRAGRFRADLYFRLNVAELHIPPLRARREDILLLFSHFAERAAERNNISPPNLAGTVEAMLIAHQWPGNVRELKVVAERFALGLPSSLLQGADAETPPNPLPLAERVAAYEKMLIADAIVEASGDMARVCEALGLPRRTLNEKMARYGILRGQMLGEH